MIGQRLCQERKRGLGNDVGVFVLGNLPKRSEQVRGSESGDEGAVLALNLVANSHSLGGNWFFVDELAAEGVAGHAGAGGSHALGPRDRGQQRRCRAVPVLHASAYLLTK